MELAVIARREAGGISESVEIAEIRRERSAEGAIEACRRAKSIAERTVKLG